MGAYLSSPICDKDTHEGSNNRLAFAASSMQGWRMSQEDAHNAILNFDDNTSLFAVYDGHGGSEIAIYCSRYLPNFIKKLNSYQEGRLNDALIESFIKFDSILLDTDVKKILQKLANDQNEETNEDNQLITSFNFNKDENYYDQLNIEEAQLLKKEAELPIEQLIQSYHRDDQHFHSPYIIKQILNNHDKINNLQINQQSETLTINSEEIQPLSSQPKSTSQRPRKPVLTQSSTIIQSNSLTRHLITDNIDELDDEDDDDSEFNLSDEETSGDEAYEHEIHEENLDNKPLEVGKAAQIQKLMTKSIMAILNRRTKKKNIYDNDQDNIKDNQNEDNESDENGEEEEEDDDDDDDDDELNDEDEEDLGMVDMDNDPGSSSGCTAVVTLLRDKQLLVANAGDSRCVVCRAGRAIDMSVDHKPEDPKERSRIEKAGYKVTLDGRVSGGLNLSRAIGDHAYKKKCSLSAEEQAITALPDIQTLTLTDQDEFMVIACDGIWNLMSSQHVIDFIRLRLEKKTLSQICEELFMHCLAPNTSGDGTGCDNMTAIIVKFNSNSLSLNNKRSLSPNPISTTETIENSNNKKFKVFIDNDTHQINSTEQISSS